ncbi:hsp90 co-chaperone Cdc37-like [Mytilus edulis]|uniref:hsp90 co-chaperone Cdc37-like n=1 Tax=Mytilus edulis TaxID=6550 RepID=UPI0039EE4944
MSTINYSKWDHIEISDDEDDTHPNIDTPSLFRWRHQARVDRMEQSKKEKEDLNKGLTDFQQKKVEIQQKLKEAEKNQLPDINKLQLEMKEIEKQESDWRAKEEELKKKEKLTPLNIDTICHDGKSKTIINKIAPKVEVLTEEEKAERQQVFVKKNKEKVKKFGMLRQYKDSQQYLTDNPELVCEESANYLVIWCIDLEMEEKHELMSHVAHQLIVLNFILELAKSMDIHPRGCVAPFFNRIQMGEKQYMEAFNSELDAFKERVKVRAKEKLDKAIQEYEEEERQKRLGPGGLDPVEVFESLPQILKDCFDKKDIALLQQVVAEMPQEEASYHIKRCVDSGLWVPGGGDQGPQGDDDGEEYDEINEGALEQESKKESEEEKGNKESEKGTDKPKQVSTEEVD